MPEILLPSLIHSPHLSECGSELCYVAAQKGRPTSGSCEAVSISGTQSGLRIIVISKEEVKDKPTDEALYRVRKEMSVFLKKAGEGLNIPPSKKSIEPQKRRNKQ